MTFRYTVFAVCAWMAVSGSGACGGLPSAHCQFKEHSRCQERLNSLASVAFKGTCSAAQGVAGDGPCPRENVVGGCQEGAQGDGSKINDWYYAPLSEQEVRDKCDGSPFLSP